MNSQGNEKQVQGTNNSSITSKLSACQKGYFSDPFLKYFVDKPRPRSSIINRGYHVRAVNMEQGFDKVIKLLQNYPQSQIISLGAGFDTSYFRLKSTNNLNNCKYIEIDFEPVLNRKKEIILNTPILKALIGSFNSEVINSSPILLQSSDYFMIKGNLSDVNLLQSSFENAQIDFKIPTVFVSECVLNYLDTKSADNLIKWIPTKFPDSLFLVYDQINPYDGFGTVMMNHFSSIGTPLGTILNYPKTIDQEKRYKDLGWINCQCQDVSGTYSSMPDKELDHINSLEMFDEYEEFDLLCAHYFILIATCGKLKLSFQNLPSSETNLNLNLKTDEVFVSLEVSNESLERFGQSSTLTLTSKDDNDKVLVIGGFGPNSKGHHERLKGITSFELNKEFQPKMDQIESDILGSRMFAGIVSVSENSVIILGGRASPYSDAFKTPLKLTEDVKGLNLTVEPLEINSFDANDFPLWRHSCTYHKDSDKIIVFGGVNKCTVSSNVFILDLKTSQWRKGKSAVIERHSHSSIIYKDYQVLISGGRSKTKSLGLIETYNIRNDTWETFTTIPNQKPRYSHTSHIVNNNKLLLLGGVVGNEAFVSLINLENHNSFNYSLPNHTPTTYPRLFIRHSSFVTKENDSEIKIATFGGGGNCFSFGTHFDKNCVIIIPNVNI